MHPYKELPEQNFWRRGVAEKLYSDINFKPSVKFKLTALNNVATAGSCFAQHIAANLENLGLNHFIAEKSPTILTKERASALGYCQFSARYGNIYTARQFRQMIEFAFDLRERITVAEESPTGWVDLLRPGVGSDTYESLHDLECDRAFHLDCIKNMFLQTDCFIFTLGLTEAWYDTDSEIIFPVCPGTKSGKFNPAKHRFVNFNTTQIVEDIRWCVEFIAKVNPQLKWIFTVSPVALSATATNRSVLVATAASKAILRAAAEEIFNLYDNCEYFPSLEITTSPPSFGQFLDADLRAISPRGVKLVMQIFRRSFVSVLSSPSARLNSEEDSRNDQINLAIKAECEETLNDPDVWHP